MRVLVTGVSGLLGYDVVNEMLARKNTCVGCSRAPSYAGLSAQLKNGDYRYAPLDICDEKALSGLFGAFRPEAVIHCAAWRDAVSAEKPENEAAVFAVNAGAVRLIARLCAEYGSRLVYVSTDYVFDGSGGAPWREDTGRLRPLNVYGRSKLEGERAVTALTGRAFIVRTAWLFGSHGKNFVDTMLRLGAERGELRVVDDQTGSPTYTKDLARLLADMAGSDAYGVYHAVSAGGYVSRRVFAEEIFRQAGLSVRVEPVSSDAFIGDPVKRPLNGRLGTAALSENGFRQLPEWKDALSRYLKEIGAYAETGR